MAPAASPASRDGLPENPRAWLVSAGRFKGIDSLRHRARVTTVADVPEPADGATDETLAADVEDVADDRLRLIFTCCHPAVPPDAQVAMTLREVCDLTTEEIGVSVRDAPAPRVLGRAGTL
jgi:RNA polymerase sigma-70 factor (ECF subfamily)